MGVMICLKHGRQSFYETCEHHYANILRGIKSEEYHIEVLNLKICSGCYSTYSFKEIENLKIDEVLKLTEKKSDKIEALVMQKYDSIKRKGICVKCYEEAYK